MIVVFLGDFRYPRVVVVVVVSIVDIRQRAHSPRKERHIDADDYERNRHGPDPVLSWNVDGAMVIVVS